MSSSTMAASNALNSEPRPALSGAASAASSSLTGGGILGSGQALVTVEEPPVPGIRWPFYLLLLILLLGLLAICLAAWGKRKQLS